MTFTLPPAVCFRVTRCCNARCGFCLAPPTGDHQPVEALLQRLDWLLSHGVKTIHFCGGEPTIHPALSQLIAHAHGRGATTKLTTNAIAIPDGLLPLLRATNTRVKVSLHGDRGHHNSIVGVEAFDQTTGNLGRFIAAGVPTSIQTTVVAGGHLGRGVDDRLLPGTQGAAAQHPPLHPAGPRLRASGRIWAAAVRTPGTP